MLPTTLQRYLNEQRAAYALEPHAFDAQTNAATRLVNSGQPAHTVALGDERGVVLVVIPADRLLDVDALREKLGRPLHPLTPERMQTLFPDCEPPAWPPFAMSYGLQAVVDVSLYSQLMIRCASGRRNVYLKLSVQEFQRLLGEATLGRFAVPLRRRPQAAASAATSAFAREAESAMASCKDLPVLPQSALDIFKLASDPRAGARDLAQVVELDSALSANILRYANSPWYGFAGQIGDVQNAIARVLGFDLVLGLAIAMSIGRSFRIPIEGPLGMNAYRRNAVYCAALTQQLARMLPQSNAQPGVAYTAGLLHNIGQLFLGHVFPRQHALLECGLLANTHVSMPEVERHLLGIGHDEIAAQLLRAWQLPEAIVTAVRRHHEHDYQGPHAIYAHLVAIANRALAAYGLGINEAETLPGELLRSVGLSESAVRTAAAALWDDRAEIERLAQLVA